MIKRKDVYWRKNEDLLNVIKEQGKASKKVAEKLRIANKELKEKDKLISSLNFEIKQLNLKIKRMEEK